jgi:hypothetical protein
MAKPNRAHKDSVFTTLFGEPQAFLELYSALMGVELPPDTQTKNVALDSVLFLDQVNDLAYLIGDTVVILAEHQSTVNPNMPLRFLLYAGRVYEKLVPDDAKYGHALLKIPRPIFIVLYNGEEPYPEKTTLRLSDAFREAGGMLPEELAGRIGLDLEVTVYNVNVGQNAALIQRSQTLSGYVAFIGACKANTKAGMSLEDAIRSAIETCINQGILTDFLEEHGTEVHNMLLTEWSNEQAMRVQRREGIEEGIGIGEARGEAKGERKTMIKVAQRLLAMGMGIPEAAQISGLPIAETESLQLKH